MAMFIMNFCLFCTLRTSARVPVMAFKEVVQFDSMRYTDSDWSTKKKIHIVKSKCCNCKHFSVDVLTTEQLQDIIVRVSDET